MFYALVNVNIANFFVLWSSIVLTSLSLDKHMSLITENHSPLVFLCPVFVFEFSFVAFCLHGFCKELLFNRAVFLPTSRRHLQTVEELIFIPFFPKVVIMASLVFLGSFTLSRIRYATIHHLWGLSFFCDRIWPLRFGVIDPVFFFILTTRLIADILTPTVFDISLYVFLMFLRNVNVLARFLGLTFIFGNNCTMFYPIATNFI